MKNFFDNAGFNQAAAEGGIGANPSNGLIDDALLGGVTAVGGGGMHGNDQVVSNLFNTANHDFDSSKFSGAPHGGGPHAGAGGLLHTSGGILGPNNSHGV